MVMKPSPRVPQDSPQVYDVPARRVVITIARQFGSGGDELARQLADAYSVPLLDREILAQAASQAGVSEETVADCERRRSFFEQVFERLALPFAGDYMDPAVITTNSMSFVTNNDYRRMIERVIAHVADEQSAVIVGHAGQVVLRDRPHVLTVLVHADMDDRVRRVMEREEVGPEEAQRLIHDRDRDWAEMFRSAYRLDCMDARLYDLVINRSRIGEEVALQLVLSAFARRPVADCGCA